MSYYFSELRQKILSRSAAVAVLGLGYVGLPLAVEVCRQGFKVFGVEVDEDKISMVNRGKSYISDVLELELREAIQGQKLLATADVSVLASSDVIAICVPTPLTKTGDPDLSFVTGAVEQCAANLRRGQLITLESTTYPGTTEEMVLKYLQDESGLKVGQDFFLAFSPERVDPGNMSYNTRNITKVVGGVTSGCTELASLFYDQIIDRVFTVSSPAAAEMTKVFENTYRSVNIALVNELMFVCDKLGLDVWEIIEAAGTKPFGIQTFYPGPGVGGHCIPIDPYFLSWKAREHGLHTRLIEMAGEINRQAVEYVVRKVERSLGAAGKGIMSAKVLVLGVAYKRDIGDCRESPALKLISRLLDLRAELIYYDPYVPQIVLSEEKVLANTPLTSRELQGADVVLIATDHSCINYQWVVDCARLVVDARFATKNIERGREKVVRI